MEKLEKIHKKSFSSSLPIATFYFILFRSSWERFEKEKLYAQHARDFLFFRSDVYSANVITQIVHGAPQHENEEWRTYAEKTGVNAIFSLSHLEPRKLSKRKSSAADNFCIFGWFKNRFHSIFKRHLRSCNLSSDDIIRSFNLASKNVNSFDFLTFCYITT